MVHRDMRSVSKRLQRLKAFGVSKRLLSGPCVAPASPGADHRGTRSVNNGLTGYREAQREQAERSPSLVRLRQPILNLGMLLSPKCNVRINLRSMVRRTFLITLAG
jgi:hypothetical protein